MSAYLNINPSVVYKLFLEELTNTSNTYNLQNFDTWNAYVDNGNAIFNVDAQANVNAAVGYSLGTNMRINSSVQITCGTTDKVIVSGITR